MSICHLTGGQYSIPIRLSGFIHASLSLSITQPWWLFVKKEIRICQLKVFTPDKSVVVSALFICLEYKDMPKNIEGYEKQQLYTII